MYGSVSATVINLVLNYFLIQKYGYIASGYTTLICYLLQALIDFFAMRKVVGCNIYNMRLIVTFSVASIVICLVSNLIFNYSLLRYALLALIMICCLCQRKRIIAIFVNMKSKTKEE